MESPLRSYRQGDEPVTGYVLERFLGRGGFGEVWKALGPGGVHAAVKVIYDLDRKRGGKELRALRLLRDIRHPNLVPLTAFWLKDRQGNLVPDDVALADPAASTWTDAASAADTVRSESDSRGTLQSVSPSPVAPATDAPACELVIVMGLAEKSLFDRLRDCQDAGLHGVPRDELLTYMEDAARAIDLLNTRHDIQHCDIKPQNILLLSGAAQVCDFGLAKAIGEVRETSMGAGTIAYGAPEVLLGKGPTSTTDQYSLAISYFELRTGELPFGSERISDVLQAKHDGIVDLSRLPPTERAVVARAADLDPTRRFANCHDFVRALRTASEISPEAVSDAPRPQASETPPTTPNMQGRPWRTPRPASWKRGLAGIALVATLLFGTWGWFSQRGSVAQGSATAMNATGDIIADGRTTENETGPAASPSPTSTGEPASQPVDSNTAQESTVPIELPTAAPTASAETSPPDNSTTIQAIADAAQVTAANTQAIVEATQTTANAAQATAQNTQEIADTTRTIAASLDQLREQLVAATSRGGVIQNPESPSDFYHNARTLEERGDYLNARKAYIRLFDFRLNVVDPYVRFVKLLRLQEGRAGAREILAELAQKNQDQASRFAMLLVEPDESRLEALRNFVAGHAHFAPAVFELSREFSKDRLGAQSLADMAQEKQLLTRFLSLVDEGELLKFYFDQTPAVGMVEDARSRFAALQHFDLKTAENPVLLSAMPSNTSWNVVLTVAEATKEIQYRLENEASFQSTGFLQFVDQRTGTRLPDPGIQLPLPAKPTKIFVQYVDIRGHLQGPFELSFDPHAEMRASGKRLLEEFPHDWVSLDEFDGRMLAYFTHLVSHRAALKEIRYGFDAENVARSFPVPAFAPDKPFEVPVGDGTYIDVPRGVKSVAVQLTYGDGTKSKVQRFPVPAWSEPVAEANHAAGDQGEGNANSRNSGGMRGRLPAQIQVDTQISPNSAPRVRFGIGF